MAAGAWVFTNAARTNLLDGTVPIASGSFKMALYLSTSNLTTASTTYASKVAEAVAEKGSAAAMAAVTVWGAPQVSPPALVQS